MEEPPFINNTTLVFLSLPNNTTEKLLGFALKDYIATIKQIHVVGPLAYVEFKTHQQALKVHQQRSHIEVKKKKIIICWKLTKEVKERNEYNYDLYGLKDDITDESLQLYFENKVNILTLLTGKNVHGNYALMKVNNQQEGEWLLENKDTIQKDIGTDNFELKVHQIKQDDKTNVLVKNLHKDLTETDELINYFLTFGEIDSLKLTEVNEKYNTKALFIKYKTEESANKMIETVNGKDIFSYGLPLTAELLKSKKDYKSEKNKIYYDKRRILETDLKGNSLFIKNIPKQLLSREAFKNYFSRYGELFDYTILIDKRIGYICYNEYDNACDCVAGNHGRMEVQFKEKLYRNPVVDVSPFAKLPFK
ncbi:polyadenylate-binding protein, putative [Entamoeba dispar SAW760]|uniref:Polyadenylate-binding protein, putative n=1 Tax=Entamoeba dispar (strain ATCC PRA-260 / SAW760) TaxID=370354 RepID=B0EUJ8_ENTDS|nr:polyadenylate-binding protein, putative [Entamoeba dispar SAW760]EDR21804.1 polyadenylate-binding protein, putative [Entamoeba dispar SAW760]|eukprot:EDR21804.1 polyadenylate-binding protein, putative [Entamoeba dispar SAW760]